MNATNRGAGTVGAAIALLALLSGCSGATTATESRIELPTLPASSGSAREVYRIDSMQTLVAESDLVVIGHATAVAPGRNAGTDVGGRLGFRDVTVEIDEVIKGSYAGGTLTLEELGWKDGEPFTVNEAAWATPGDTMLMGLKATTRGSTAAGPRFILTSSAARFFLKADGGVATNYLKSSEANSFVTEAAALNAEELIATAKSAAD